MNKTTLSVTSLGKESDEQAFWLSKSPAERLEALEFMRQVMYGYDPLTTRLQRVLDVTRRP